ncbi:MAG: hypothetical protein IIA02_10920 [Proteobacteria bacterium]|uniref:hypothetical protein n=1 Tax=Aquabacterium sp. TaxID=1872578 RepID=UPI0035C730CF|nr:hypothetical protein [Pseudomonadota bacterium]
MASFFYSNDDAAQAGRHLGRHAALASVKPLAAMPLDSGAAGEAPSRRHEVTPPSRFASSSPVGLTWVRRFWQWLWDLDEAPRALAPTSGLRAIQSEFVAALWDLQSLRANQVRDQIESARSLRELWHLRADVFKVIAVHRGQMEAQMRLDGLDGHFPVRASRRSEDARGRVTTW